MAYNLALLLFVLFTYSHPNTENVLRYNGCYKSVSADLSASGKYYLRFYSDGTVIEYETPQQVKVSFDKGTLAKVMQKGSTNEKFPLKTGNYYIKEAAIKITLNAKGETVTYEGTVTKRSFKGQRHSTRTNERAEMEFTFIRIKDLK